jgi:hypothetical protein
MIDETTIPELSLEDDLPHLQHSVIDYHNTPFSLGANLVILTRNSYFRRKSRCTLKLEKKIMKDHRESEGYYLFFPRANMHLIYIKKDIALFERVLEILVHETSHMVDHIFEMTCVKTIDTEVRAYTHDHIFGLCLRHMNYKSPIN